MRAQILWAVVIVVMMEGCSKWDKEALSEPVKSRIQWLETNVAPIKSVEPSDTDFSDLAPLGKAIGDARLVMLGEQTHGDGTTFLMKSRIIQYLHDVLGFDVLAFESGFYDMRNVWDSMKRGDDPFAATQLGLFGIWSGSEQVRSLIDYIGRCSRTIRPLELTGFDDQLTCPGGCSRFLSDASSFLITHHIDTAKISEWSLMTTSLDSVLDGKYYDTTVVDTIRHRKIIKAWDSLSLVVQALPDTSSETQYWKQLFRSMRVNVAQSLEFAQNDSVNDTDIRDVQMGENLLWLLKHKYKNKKVIVWAASAHILRDPMKIKRTVIPEALTQFRTMGSIVGTALGNQCYCIGFIASEGKYGRSGSTGSINLRTPKSLEGMLSCTVHENAFVDFRHVPETGRWLLDMISTGPCGYGIVQGLWALNLDGIIYTRHMIPSTRRL